MLNIFREGARHRTQEISAACYYVTTKRHLSFPYKQVHDFMQGNVPPTSKIQGSNQFSTRIMSGTNAPADGDSEDDRIGENRDCF